MHGGRLWAESAGQECGSTFRLRVPLAADEPAGVVDQEPAPLPVAYKVKPLRILFIEDSTDVLNLMKMELEELGYVVFTEADAVAGLRVAQRERPDVIVSDIKMPGLDGYEFIRRLRQMPEMAAVPAIALTGFGLKQDVEKAIAAGYNAHLCKPVEIEQLTALFNQLTRQ
jgi:two-component system CheB/CheR fusion protein